MNNKTNKKKKINKKNRNHFNEQQDKVEPYIKSELADK